MPILLLFFIFLQLEKQCGAIWLFSTQLQLSWIRLGNRAGDNPGEMGYDEAKSII